MVYFRQLDSSRAFIPFDTGVLENQGHGLVSALADLSYDSFYIRRAGDTPLHTPIVSIVICTYGRAESLNETLTSLTAQTFKDFEVILLTEKGNLSELRDKGLRRARGGIVSFIDDDVYCPPTWLESVVGSFGKGVVGVTGPTTITREYQSNRDCLKYRKLRAIQERFFKVSSKPGHLSPYGAPSMASNFENCAYQGEVDYLECCNMSVKKKEAVDVGGFDAIYTRTGEWAEPDLSLKLGKVGRLWFSPDARLYHRPSQQGIYKARLSIAHRWENFMAFQKRWIKPSLGTYFYRLFVWVYLNLKSFRLV